MALLQISEPGCTPEPHALKRAIGIDLGTTNSLVATVKNGNAESIADVNGKTLLPSVAYYGELAVEIGHSAKAMASQYPLDTIMSVKRLMGLGVDDIRASDKHFPYQFADVDSAVPHIKTAGGNKSPIDVSADILRTLAKRGEDFLGGSLDGAVITVPAYFDDAQRQATRDAARLAGLHVLRLLNEPTAAAVAYGLDRQEDSVVAVYDLGGGTFDISLLRMTRGVFEVLATGGDSALGGDDFDYAIMEYIQQQLALEESLSALSAEQKRQLLTLSTDLKEQLSESQTAQGEFDGQLVLLTREKCNELVDGLIQKTLRACKRSLRDAGLVKEDITSVVLVGGSTRLLRLREKVADFFEQEPLNNIDPDRVVAIGAALQANVLVGNKTDNKLLLLDVVPLSLGLETMGGLVEKVIHRNTTIPVAKAQEFTTFKDGQTAMSIHVVQGEREMVADCRSLARFELRGIPPMVAGAAHIQVTFQVDADGLLSVSAQEKSTGVFADVTVKPSYGLRDDEIAQMLKSSFAHAQSDVAVRALREQQVEAERVIESLLTALAENGDRLLDEEEKQVLNTELAKLQEYQKGTDVDAIRDQIEIVAQASEVFAARRMNTSIKQALAGHHLDEF